MTSVEHESADLVSRLRLAPLAIWVTHASLCYGLVAVHCHLADIDEQVLGRAAVRALLFVMTVIAASAAVAVALISYRGWRTLHESADPNGRRAFTAAYTGLAACFVLVYLGWATVLISVAALC